ncbi:MAG: hypothetical protein ACI84D_000428 [Thalassolituus oleivorans]|jgi:hypothetical protein
MTATLFIGLFLALSTSPNTPDQPPNILFLRRARTFGVRCKRSFPCIQTCLEEAGYSAGFARKGWGPGRFAPGGRTRNPAGEEYDDFDIFLAERPPDRPFTFWFGSYDPHRGYEEDAGQAAGMDLDAMALAEHFPDSEEVRGDVADYYFEVQRFDREVGELLAALEEAGEIEKTVVVMTGDHGMPFPRCKGRQELDVASPGIRLGPARRRAKPGHHRQRTPRPSSGSARPRTSASRRGQRPAYRIRTRLVDATCPEASSLTR